MRKPIRIEFNDKYNKKSNANNEEIRITIGDENI